MVLYPWMKPVKCAHEAGGQHRSLSFKFPSFLRPAGSSLSATGGANQMFPQFSFLNPAGLGWPSTSSNLFSSNQLPLSTGKVIPTAQPPVSTTSIGSFPFNPHFRQPHDIQNSTGTEKSFFNFLSSSNHSSLAPSNEIFPFLNSDATNTSRSVFDIFPKDQIDFKMDNKNLTAPNVGQGVFKTWSFGVSPTGNRTAGKFFEHVYTDFQNKSDSLSTNITVFGLQPSNIKDNPNSMISSSQFSHHGNLGKVIPTNKTQGSPFQTMFQELMLPSSVPNSSQHFINLPESIRNRIEAMNSEMLTDKLKHSHIPSSEHISNLDVNNGNTPDNEVENIFKRLDLPMFKRKHLKLPSLEIQDRLRQLVNKWIRNQEAETNQNISALRTPTETKVPSEVNIPKEASVPSGVNIPKETKVPSKVNTPKETWLPSEVKTYKETKVSPEVKTTKVTQVPSDANLPKETKVPPALNTPKEKTVPLELNKPKETKLLPELIYTSKVTKFPSKVIQIHKESIIPQEFINKTRSTDKLKVPAIGGKTSENGEMDMIMQLSKDPTRKSVEISNKTTIVPSSEQRISKADRRNDTKWNKLTMEISTSLPFHLNKTSVTAFSAKTRKKEMKVNSSLPDLKIKFNRTNFLDSGVKVKIENTFNQPDKTRNMTDLQKTLPIYSATLPDIKANNLNEHSTFETYPEIRKFKNPKDVVIISAATNEKSGDSIISSKSNDKKNPIRVINPPTNTLEESYTLTTLGQTNVSTHLTKNLYLHSETRPEKDIEQNHVGLHGMDINLTNFQKDKQGVASGKIISGMPFYNVTESKTLNKSKAALPITTPVMHYVSTRGTYLQRLETLTTSYRRTEEKMQTNIVMLPPIATPPPIIIMPPVAIPPPVVMPPPVATPPPIFMPPQIYNIEHGGSKFKTALSDMNDLGNKKHFIGHTSDNYMGNINVSPKETIVNKNIEKQKRKLNTDKNKIESKQDTNRYIPDILKSADRNEPVQPAKTKRIQWDRKTAFESTRQKHPPKVTGLLERMLVGSSRNTVDLFKSPSSPKFTDQNKSKKIPTIKNQIFPEVIRNDNNRADPKISGQKSRSLPISILEMFYNGLSKKKSKKTLTPYIPEISNRKVKEKTASTNLPQTDKSETFLGRMVQDPHKSEIKTYIQTPAYQDMTHSTVKYNDYVPQQKTDALVNVGSESRRSEPVMNKRMLFLSQPNNKVNDKTRLGINILNYLLSF